MEKITDLKTFLDERVAIEKDYCSKMESWSKKWKSKSENCRPRVCDEDEDDDAAPGLFCILGNAGAFVAPNTSRFIESISGDVSIEIDTLLRELNAAIETGTKGVSNLWTLLKEKEAGVAKDFMTYKKNYKNVLDYRTREIMKFTDCFVRADSVGYLLVDDLNNAISSRNLDKSSSSSSSSSSSISGPSSPFASFSFSTADSAQILTLEQSADTYRSYQQYCGSVVEAKSVLGDLESLVNVLGSNADSIASRSANVLKTISSGMTIEFVQAWEEIISRHRRIGHKLNDLYTLDAMRKLTTSETPLEATEETIDTAASSTEGDMTKGVVQRESMEESFDGDDYLVPSSAGMPKTKSKVITPGDTDLFKPRVHSNEWEKKEEKDASDEGDDNNLTEEEKQELAELDFDALEDGGEFNLDAMPPLLATVHKMEILNMCSSTELNKSAMTRWDMVVLVLTEGMLYVHKINEDLQSKITDSHTIAKDMYEIFKLILGVKPLSTYVLSDISVAVLLHPMYQDAFEVTLKSSQKKQIFLSKSTTSTTHWLDALSLGSETPDGAVIATSTEL